MFTIILESRNSPLTSITSSASGLFGPVNKTQPRYVGTEAEKLTGIRPPTTFNVSNNFFIHVYSITTGYAPCKNSHYLPFIYLIAASYKHQYFQNRDIKYMIYIKLKVIIQKLYFFSFLMLL